MLLAVGDVTGLRSPLSAFVYFFLLQFYSSFIPVLYFQLFGFSFIFYSQLFWVHISAIFNLLTWTWICIMSYRNKRFKTDDGWTSSSNYRHDDRDSRYQCDSRDYSPPRQRSSSRYYLRGIHLQLLDDNHFQRNIQLLQAEKCPCYLRFNQSS